MKSEEELNALKEEIKNVSRKLHELTPEELEQVSVGKTIFGFGYDSSMLVAGKTYSPPTPGPTPTPVPPRYTKP